MPSTQFRSATPTAQFRSAPPTGKFAATPGTTHIHSGKPPSHHHKHHHHGHGHAFVTTGIVFPAYYPFYPYYPYYGYPPYYGPTAPPPGVWYYCPAYGAYYPYVSECPSGWQTVQPGHY
jgi:hypothetical protein